MRGEDRKTVLLTLVVAAAGIVILLLVLGFVAVLDPLG